MITALISLLAAQASVEREGPQLGVAAGVALATGMAPGANFGVTAGARLRIELISIGIEGTFYLPGEDKLARPPDRLPRGGACERNCTTTYSSLAVTGTLPVCVHKGLFSACGVAVGGAAVSRTGPWQPIFNAGARLAFDPHLTDSFSFYIAVQALAGIVRTSFSGWEGAPLQMGLTFAGSFAT